MSNKNKNSSQISTFDFEETQFEIEKDINTEDPYDSDINLQKNFQEEVINWNIMKAANPSLHANLNNKMEYSEFNKSGKNSQISKICEFIINQLTDEQTKNPKIIKEICKDCSSRFPVSLKPLGPDGTYLPATNLYCTIINKIRYKNRTPIATSSLKNRAENDIPISKRKMLKGLALTVKPLEEVDEDEFKTADQKSEWLVQHFLESKESQHSEREKVEKMMVGLYKIIRLKLATGPPVNEAYEKYPFLFYEPHLGNHFKELTSHDLKNVTEHFEKSCDAIVNHYINRKGNVKLITEFLKTPISETTAFELIALDFKENINIIFQTFEVIIYLIF